MMESVATEKTAEELKREIDELNRRHHEITERLKNPRGLRKAPAFGQNVQTATMGGPRQMGPQRGVIRRNDDFVPETQPPTKKRLLSTVVKVDDEQVEKAAAKKPDEPLTKGESEDRITDRAGVEIEEGQINGRADFPLSSRRESTRGVRNFQQPDSTLVEILPRVLVKEENPSLAKRNRRMFGALMGTLERFKQEDQQLSASEAFARRSESLKRAEQRAQEERERLRQQEREQLAERRRTDLTLRARIAAKAEEKRLDLLFLQWTEHHGKLNKFLRTKSEPHIFYMPAKLTEELEKALESQQNDFLEWKNTRREELSKYQKERMEQHLADAEAEFERWVSRRNVPSLGLESATNDDGGKAVRGGAPFLKAGTPGDEEVDDELDDIADVELGNVLEEADELDRSKKEAQGVVEYMSGDDDTR